MIQKSKKSGGQDTLDSSRLEELLAQVVFPSEVDRHYFQITLTSALEHGVACHQNAFSISIARTHFPYEQYPDVLHRLIRAEIEERCFILAGWRRVVEQISEGTEIGEILVTIARHIVEIFDTTTHIIHEHIEGYGAVYRILITDQPGTPKECAQAWATLAYTLTGAEPNAALADIFRALSAEWKALHLYEGADGKALAPIQRAFFLACHLADAMSTWYDAMLSWCRIGMHEQALACLQQAWRVWTVAWHTFSLVASSEISSSDCKQDNCRQRRDTAIAQRREAAQELRVWCTRYGKTILHINDGVMVIAEKTWVDLPQEPEDDQGEEVRS